jgi:hypothetical protein
MAETGQTINTQPPPPPPPPKIEVFEVTNGYGGPIELPPADQQAVDAWLADVAPYVIRHRDENGAILAEKQMEQGGNYLVFARAVFASAPGLGKTPVPEGAASVLGALVSNGIIGGVVKNVIGSALKGVLANLPGAQLKALMGAGTSEYAISCTLRAYPKVIDTASVSITERGTANVFLMGFFVASSDVKFDVGCAHNGEKAGPFVRDVRLVVVKFP